jgi:hypothetical protein
MMLELCWTGFEGCKEAAEELPIPVHNRKDEKW